jgi:hypothetical protein
MVSEGCQASIGYIYSYVFVLYIVASSFDILLNLLGLDLYELMFPEGDDQRTPSDWISRTSC